MTIYQNEKQMIADVITVNCAKMFSVCIDGTVRLASNIEKQIHKKDQAAAAARLAIDKAMRASK